jgi:hypothetical protein
MCLWAKGDERFLYENDKSEKYEDRVLCITTGKFGDRQKDFRLLISDR